MQTRHWREGDLDGWTIPKFGESASADLPKWLVERLCDGRMVINSFGGFTSNEEGVGYVSLAGDSVVLNESGTVDVFRPEEMAAFISQTAEMTLAA